MNYHEAKSTRRKHNQPIKTHHDGWKDWALAVLIGLCLAAALFLGLSS